MGDFNFSAGNGGFSDVKSGVPKVDSPSLTENHNRDYSKYLHAEIENGKGIFVDGEIRDKTVLIESIKDVYKNLATKSSDGDISPKARFLADASTIFKLATSEIVGPSVDSVVQELSDSVDDVVIPDTKEQKITTKVVEKPTTGLASVFTNPKDDEETSDKSGIPVEDAAEDYE